MTRSSSSGAWTPSGKVAIVTGAASGIGAAIAEALLVAGATVITTDLAGADEPLDVRDATRFDELVADTVRLHGRVDLLVNNAGIALGGDVAALGPEHWDRIIDVNVRGVVNGMRAVYPHMVERGSGRIVNVASMAGLVPTPLLTAYSMTKHAVVGLSSSWGVEARRHGVRVHALCPGVIETPLLDKRGPDDLPDAMGPLDPRRYLSSMLGKPYPADRLAADLIAGMARDRDVIVAPRAAAAAWWVQRLAPGLVRRLGARALADERTAQATPR